MLEVSEPALLQSGHTSQQELSSCRVTAIAFNAVIGNSTAQVQKTLTHCLCVDDVVRHQGGRMWGIGELWASFEINRQSLVVDCVQVAGGFLRFGITQSERAFDRRVLKRKPVPMDL